MKVLQYFAVIGCVVFSLSGCSFEEDLAGSQDPLYPPTGIMATTIDSNTVLLTWTPSPNDSDSRFQTYKLYWTYVKADDSTRAKTDSVELPRGSSSYTVTGLTNGVEYYFLLSVVPDDIALKFFPLIYWAPAAQYGGISLPTQAVLAMFDSLQSPAEPVVFGLDNSRAQVSGDLYLESDMTLKSASMKGSGWRRTLFSTEHRSASTLQVPMTMFPAVGTFIDTVISIQPSTIYYCKTQDGHYARLYVKDISSGAGSGVLIHLDISYQSTPNLPYAKRSQK